MGGKHMKPQQEKPTTFDRYAADYAVLLHDPLREKFASSNRFFFERKIQVIRRFFRSVGINSQNLAWLDIGCGQGRSEEHTSELQSQSNLVCRLLLEKTNYFNNPDIHARPESSSFLQSYYHLVS